MRHSLGCLTAVIGSLLALAAGEAGAASLTVTAELEHPVAVVGYPCFLKVTVKNPNASDVTVTASSIAVGSGLAGTVSAPFSDGFGSGNVNLIVPAGGEAVGTGIFVPSAAGSGTLTVSVGSGSTPIQVSVGPVAAATESMEIRHNIILTTSSGSSINFNSPALIVLHGTPGGMVGLQLRAPSGEDRGSVQSYTSPSGVTQGSPVHLDASGNGSYMWDGHAGTTLDSGVWWVIATGAVNARKPVLILDHHP